MFRDNPKKIFDVELILIMVLFSQYDFKNKLYIVT